MTRTVALLLLFLFGGAAFLRANLPCDGSACAGRQCECPSEDSSLAPPGVSGDPVSGAPGGGGSGGSGGHGAEPELAHSALPASPSPPAMITVRASSLKSTITFGAAPNESLNTGGLFSVYTKPPTPLVFTPQLLQYRNWLLDRISQTDVVAARAEQILGANWEEKIEAAGDGGFGRIRVDDTLGGDITHQVRIFREDREQMIFQFTVGNAVGRQTANDSAGNVVLVMRDANGADTTSLPVYYDLCFSNGDVVRYSVASGAVVACHLSSGRVVTPADAGLIPVYDGEGNIRQIWSRADGLADVVVTELGVSYEIRFYAPSQIQTPVNGVYTTVGAPHTVWRIENPHPGADTRVNVIKTVGGQSDVWEFEYSHASEGWLLKKPGNQSVTSQTTSWDATNTVRTEVIVERTPAGVVASRKAKTFQEYPFGERLRTSTDDPGGANLVTAWEYHAGIDAYGEIGRLHRVNYPDGNWATYRYDHQGRIISTVTPWKNTSFDTLASRARAELHSYVPHDPRDTVTELDARPRTVEVKILNITVSKTLSAYYTDNGCQVVVVERCQRPEAVYGDADNLRTEWRYYPQGTAANSASAGRLHTVTYPHGVRDTFAYEYGTWQANADPAIPGVFTAGTGHDLRASATRGTTASPAGIANHTLRRVAVFDAAGDEVFAARQVYTGTDYAPLDWRLMTYDGLHRRISLLQSNGELTETTWNCCAKASETLPDGTQRAYAYDALRRLSVQTLVGMGDQPDLVTTYAYDAVGRVVAETVSGGNLSTTATHTYDLAGRLTASVDMQGLTTAYTHLPGVNTGSQRRGATTTVTHPGGFTTTQETFCDGQSASVTGDAQVSRYFDYGVNADGTQWTLLRTGGGDSPRWEKVTTDCLGRVKQVEKSGFNGTVTTGYHYNAVGQLVRMEQTGMADTLYEYDALGIRFRSGLDVDDDGTLTLASNDRVSETSEEYYQDAHDAWWLMQTQKIYATANDATATAISTNRRRLSGFSSNIVSESEHIDIHGNVINETQAIERVTKTVIASILHPDSVVAEQQVGVNGLLMSQRSRSNLTTTFGYDGLRRRISVTEPRTGTVNIAYHTDPGKIGLAASRTDAAGNSTSYDYDTITGRLLWKKNALDKYTRYAYNSRGQQIRVWGNAEYPVEYGYDQYGQKIGMTTFRTGNAWTGATWPDPAPAGDTTTWTFDAASGLVTAKIYADGHGPTYTYTPDGKLATRAWARTDANGDPLVTTYSYDSATGELVGIDYSDSTPDIAYSYTRAGQPATVTDVVGTRTFAYNAQLQEVSEAITGGLYSKVLARTYTANGMKGRKLGLAVDNVQNYTYRYDAYGRMDQIATSAGTFEYTRLPDSNLVSQMTRPNGVSTIWSYEVNRNLITQVQNGTISTYDYVNDAIGRRTSVSRSGTAYPTSDTIMYTYNNRSELIGAVSDNVPDYTYAYTYDPIGNRISANEAGVSWTYVANNLNQYTTMIEDQVSMFPTYDLDGNMTYRPVDASTGWTQVWNGENRMVETWKGNDRLEFKYDYMGRRVEKKVYEGQTLTSHFRYIYDAFKLVEESSASHANYSLRCYVWQPESIDLDVVLQMNDMNESTCLFYSYDANKNIHAILDNIGHVISNYNYDSFGNIIEINGKYALINPYRFSSEFYDDDIAYNYFIYRYYCSKIGRWIARDKIEEIGGENLLAFVYNDAVNKYDVLGNSATGSITVKIAICIAKCGMKSAMKKFYLKALSDANITGKISESCVENGGVLPSWVDLTEEPFHIFVPKADVLDNLKECLIKSNIFDKTVKIESETKIMKNSNLRCDNENKNIPYTLILEIKMYAVVSGVKKELTSEQKVYNNKAGIIAWCNCCQ